MTVSPYFQEEIDQVDATKTLVFVVNSSTHAEFEFSYSGLTCTGGSELACEYAASELLEAMGFRWFTSAPWGIIRPTSIPTGLSRAKSQYWMPSCAMFPSYSGHAYLEPTPSFPDSQHGTDGATLNARQDRFEVLNGFNRGAYPSSSRWLAIVKAHTQWFRDRPWLMWPHPAGLETALAQGKFNLTPGAHTSAQRAELVQMCASELLKVGLNEWHRTNFEPADGDLNESDWVFPFSKAVCQAVRAGTAAIDTNPAQAGVPTAQLGIYAYAGHKLPPTDSVAPYVYTMVAVWYNGTDFSFEQLIDMHGDKAAVVLIREYWDAPALSDCAPFVHNRMKNGYSDIYDVWRASGALAMTAEFAPAWIVNIIGTRALIQKCKTGTTTYTDALNEVVTRLFGGDAAVTNLYLNWLGNPSGKFTKYNLRKACEIVSTMADGWYKTLFEQYFVIYKKKLYMPPQIAKANNPNWPATAPGDTFQAACLSYAKNLVGTRFSEVTHSYGLIRQDMNEVLRINYPAIWTGRKNNTQTIAGYPQFDTDPDWKVYPEVPSHAEFTAALTQLTADTPHDVALDEMTDLVLVRGVTPVTLNYDPAVNLDAPHFFTLRHVCRFMFVGPGTVVFTPAEIGAPLAGAVPIRQSYGTGLHQVLTPSAGGFLTSCVGGEIFADTFGGIYRDPHAGGSAGGSHWLYIPTRASGHVLMEARSRWTFYDQDGRFDLGSTSSPGYDPVRLANLGPGQIMVDNQNTNALFDNLSCNRWLSLKASVVLVPRTIATEDFPNRAKVHVI